MGGKSQFQGPRIKNILDGFPRTLEKCKSNTDQYTFRNLKLHMCEPKNWALQNEADSSLTFVL